MNTHKDKGGKQMIWRGFTFENEEDEYLFLNTVALNTRIVTPDERDRLFELSKKYNK